MMRMEIAAAHEAFALTGRRTPVELANDHADFIIAVAKALVTGGIERGITLCGRGVGVSIAAKKAPIVCAGLIRDVKVQALEQPSGKRGA